MASLQQLLQDFGDSPPPINGDTLNNASLLSFIADGVANASVSAIPVAPTTAVPGAPYSALYAFVDCLTDTGNVSLATFGTLPVSPPYADRSFSNGPVWVQDLAQSLGIPQLQPSLAGGTDFAYGGAQTGQTPTHAVNPTHLTSQYGQFLSQVPSPQPGALYAVWIGSNDVLDIADNSALTSAEQQAEVSAAVNNEVSVLSGLASHGAQNLLVLNVPDLGNTPHEQARGPAQAASAQSLAQQYNSDLATALQPL